MWYIHLENGIKGTCVVALNTAFPRSVHVSENRCVRERYPRKRMVEVQVIEASLLNTVVMVREDSIIYAQKYFFEIRPTFLLRVTSGKYGRPSE
jgi:hypothetical protein